MNANDQNSHGAAVTNDELVGKMFVCLSRDMRQCLICDRAFTRQAAAEHADTVCYIRRRRIETEEVNCKLAE